MACTYTGEPCAFPDSEESCTCCSGCHVINCKKCQKSEQRWYAGMPYFVCLKTGKKIEALNDICSSFRGNCMLCAHVEKPDDTERYWYYKCKLKKQKPIDEYGHIDPLVRKMEVKVMVKIVFDIESCLECPSCEEQEAVFGHAFLRHSLINVCPECEGGPGYGPYIPEILEQLNGRCVEDEDGNVSGVPDWCPRLASARDVADESFEEEE